jgi:hypothetical protein
MNRLVEIRARLEAAEAHDGLHICIHSAEDIRYLLTTLESRESELKELRPLIEANQLMHEENEQLNLQCDAKFKKIRHLQQKLVETEAALEVAKDALEFYADDKSWRHTSLYLVENKRHEDEVLSSDCGKNARQALKKIEALSGEGETTK